MKMVNKIWLLTRNRPQFFLTDLILSPLGYQKKKMRYVFMYIKHHTICRWCLLVEVLKIDIKYTFLVRFYKCTGNDRLFID